MQAEQINRIIDQLHEILKRPWGFFLPHNPEDAASFLSGFRNSLGALFDLHITLVQAREYVIIQRGHPYTARDTWKELRDAGYSAEQITEELILIEISVWQRVRDEL